MRNRISLFALVLIVFAFSPLAANATVVSQDCHGGYLVGFNAMRGVWVDRIGAICRPWNAAAQSVGDVQDQALLATSGGGGQQRVECPNGYAVSQLEYWLPNISGQDVAERITLTCQRVQWPHDGSVNQPVVDTTGDTRGDNCNSGLTGAFCADSHQPIDACDTGAGATGFDANVGQFVGSLHLHCGAWPAQSFASGGGSAPPPAAPRPVIAHLGHPKPPSSAPVQGSWFYSCSKASLYGNVLSASCKTTTGLEVATSLDLTTCNQPATAANINGKLVCESGVASSGGGTSGAPAPAPAPAPSPGPAAGVPPSDVIEGDWKSSEGPMTFTQQGKHHLDGTYAQDSGRIRAEREQGHWMGFWSESKSDHKCNHPRLGSDYWGQMDFVFTDGNRHFEGMWSYCDALPASGAKWTGDRIK